MKRPFSERAGIPPKPEIKDEAPEWLRNVILTKAIVPLLRYETWERHPISAFESRLNKPIDCSALIEHIALSNQMSPPPGYQNAAFALQALEQQLKSLNWGRFYDVLELLANTLTNIDRNNATETARRFRFTVNSSFAVGNVAWFLDDENVLIRSRSIEFTTLEDEVRHGSAAPFVRHLDKAKKFLDARPSDSANAIKESVMALESVARTLDPSAKTLGDALKTFRKNTSLPSLLLTTIEKVYAFASSEPGVRHASPINESVERKDAEFIYITSMAILRYLDEKSN